MSFRGAFTIILGVLLLAEGAWGLFSPVVLGVLSTNLLHATIHIVLGVVAILAAKSGHAAGYLLFVGILLLVVGVLWWVPGTRGSVADLLAVNKAVANLNIAVGLVSLFVARAGR